MFERLKDMPVYSAAEGEIGAERYNLFRLALLRLGSPLQINLPGLRSLDMRLDEDSWVVIDTKLNDLPVVAWTLFNTDRRDNLHLPIRCRITHYHAHATLVMETALRETADTLREQL